MKSGVGAYEAVISMRNKFETGLLVDELKSERTFLIERLQFINLSRLN